LITNQIAPSTIQQIDPISRALSSLSASTLSSVVAKNDELIRSSLEELRTIFFICLIVATVAVLVGVVLEEAEAGMHAIKPVLPLDPMTVYRWARTLVKIGWILIVVGVAGEGVFEAYLTRTDGILSTFENILLTEARKESSGAVLGAALANIEVAEAKKQAAANELEAQQLKADNVRLEAIIAPRSLSLDQQQRIADVLRKFNNRGVLVKSYGTDGEGAALAGQIIATLQAADTIVADSRGSEIVAGQFDSGVHVRAPAADLDFAAAIADALSTIGKLQVFPVNDPEPRAGAAMGGGGSPLPIPTRYSLPCGSV
jgi:hypothetical protein